MPTFGLLREAALLKKTLPFIALLVLAALAGYGLWAVSRPVPVPLQGQIEAREINVAAKIPGRIAKVLVREGDRVAAGAPLFVLESPEIEAKVAQATAARDVARAVKDKANTGARPQEIAAARANWERAKAGADLAEVTFKRTDNLFRDGVLARQKRDEAEANAIAAREAASAAKSQYELAQAGARGEDRTAAAAQERQAEGAISEANAYFAETAVRAPQAGEVANLLATAGEIAPAGFPVVTLVDLGDSWVVLNLRETALAQWPMGREFDGTVPALGYTAVRFKVYYVSPLADFATWRPSRQAGGFDVRSFELRARPLPPEAGLRPGMSVLIDTPH
jgi:HlyD family secretion protein